MGHNLQFREHCTKILLGPKHFQIKNWAMRYTRKITEFEIKIS